MISIEKNTHKLYFKYKSYNFGFWFIWLPVTSFFCCVILIKNINLVKNQPMKIPTVCVVPIGTVVSEKKI